MLEGFFECKWYLDNVQAKILMKKLHHASLSTSAKVKCSSLACKNITSNLKEMENFLQVWFQIIKHYQTKHGVHSGASCAIFIFSFKKNEKKRQIACYFYALLAYIIENFLVLFENFIQKDFRNTNLKSGYFKFSSSIVKRIVNQFLKRSTICSDMHGR